MRRDRSGRVGATLGAALLAASIWAGPMAGAGPLGTWPMLFGDLQRTARTATVITTAAPRRIWQFDGSHQTAPLGAPFGPVIGQGVIYVTAATQALPTEPNEVTPGVLALDARTGAVRWSLPTGPGTKFTEDVKGSPAIGSDGTIYVAFGDSLVALKDDGSSVSVLWSYSPEFDVANPHPEWEGFTRGPTVAPNGRIYLPTVGGFLAAINPPSGSNGPTPAWAFQTNPRLIAGQCTEPPLQDSEIDLQSVPAIAGDGTIYVGSDETEGVLWHLRDDGSSATMLHQQTIDPTASVGPGCTLPPNRHDMNMSPTIDQSRGRVYIGSDDGKVYAFALADLAPIWSRPAGSQSAIDSDLGPEDSHIALAPDGTIVVGSGDGLLYALRPDGGSAWSKRPCSAGSVEAGPVISGNGLVVAGSPCGIWTYRLTDGAVLWHYGSDTVESAPAIGSDGTIYFPSDATTTTPSNGEASLLTALGPPSANVSVTLTDSPDPVRVGRTLTYKAVVRNAGPSAATITLTDTLPASLSLVSATTTRGSCTRAGNKVTCNLGAFATGAAATVTIGARVLRTGSASDTVKIASNVPDPSLANNTATVLTTLLR